MAVNFKTEDGVVHVGNPRRRLSRDVTMCEQVVYTHPAWIPPGWFDIVFAVATDVRATCFLCLGEEA